MRSRTARLAALALSCFGSAALHAQVNVTTYHNDNARTGQNIQETTLTPSNVNSSQFGKLFTVPVDGVAYSQPLYLSNVTIAGAVHNVVYMATEHDSVYAIDGDTGTIYWQKSLIPAGGSTVSSGGDLGCGDIATEVGITGTPVIDATTGTLYVVAKSKVNGVISQYLHALDVSTAAEKFGGPVNIQASVPGTATDGDGSMLTFSPRMENQRAALLLENGHVIITWASHCDKTPWHGWIMSYGATSLVQEGAANMSADGSGNGIWMSAGGPAADPSGNIYFATGNGTWNGTTDLGDSIVKLGPPANGRFPVFDYFTPFNQAALASVDHDVSAGGLVLLPTLASGQQLLVLIGKEGKLYLVDRNNMGKYCGTQPACTSSDPNIVQEIPNAFTGIWGTPGYWNGNLYWAGGNADTKAAEQFKAFSFNAGNSGLVSTTPTSMSAKSFNFSGPVPSISANGNTNGIVWGLDNGAYKSTCSAGVNCQVLYAYDATNLGNMLYNSSQAANNRDVPGGAVKFTSPTVVNGKVYVGSMGSISAFGLLSTTVPIATAPTFSPIPGSYTAAQSVTLNDVTPGATIYYTTDGTVPTTLSTRYTTAITISGTATIRALAVATGYSNSNVSTGTYTIAASGTAPVDVTLNALFNVNGMANEGATVVNGGMDGLGYAYSSKLLGSSVTWAGTPFVFGTAGVANAISGGTIALPAGTDTTLEILATGVNGNQANQSFVVTYTDGTTTTFRQSLSDWKNPQNYAGEAKAVTMAYRVNPNGTTTGATATGPFYLYGYSFALNPAKTVKSLTLPGNRNVVVLAIALVPTQTVAPPPPPPPPPPGSPTPVSLTSVANVFAIFNDGATVTNGGMDTLGYAYSGTLLGSSVSWSGTTFTLGSAGAADAISGGTVPLPAGNFTAVQLLATANRGNQTGQTFTVTYTDGTTTSAQLSLSDWFTPQSYAGESKAATLAYRVTPNGTTGTGPYYIYGYSIAINSAKTVKSLSLPGNRKVVVLAVALVPSSTTTPPPATTPTPVSLAPAANIYGLFNDGSTVTNGGLDTLGYAYSDTLLGSSVTWSGTTFTLGVPASANAASSGVVTLPAGNFATLQLLATAVRGNQTAQTFTVTYTDGTTSVFKQSLSDWFTPQSYAGESKAVTMSYRLTPTGAMGTGPFYLYGYSFALNSAKTVKSLTLPGNRNVVVVAASLLPPAQ